MRRHARQRLAATGDPVIAPAVRIGLAVLSLVGGPVVRAVDRALRRKPDVSPTCPACDDDPAERCGVCGRRRSRVEVLAASEEPSSYRVEGRGRAARVQRPKVGA